MPSRRMIDPAFWQSESIARLTMRQRLLFIGLFSNADDQGRMKAHPALIRSIVFPYDEIQSDEITQDLKVIQDTDSIKIYADGNSCEVLQITGWWKYQNPQWAYPSKIEPPEGWHDRLRYRQNEHVIKDNWGESLPNDLGNDLPNDDGANSGNALGGSIELELVKDSIELELDKSCADAPVMPPKRNAKDELRIDATLGGKILAGLLRECATSQGHRPPEYYANGPQRDGYLAVFAALGDGLEEIVRKAIKREIASRGALLAYLEGCVKNGRNRPTGANPPSKIEQAFAISRQHDAERAAKQAAQAQPVAAQPAV